ncbi:hypothetical protein CHS0354_007418 [Potamilus streckersoni]|uniref:Uncharacterized protein n=1 Tax=Potamilus streckersoni TaxID=2493646 RepID=A0AAE0W3E7_9BIVA|nr:hypothetical protein CHS0354_007418 [Potamilus streckersoni]
MLCNLLLEVQSDYAISSDDVECTNIFEHTIGTGTAHTILQPPRRISQAKCSTREGTAIKNGGGGNHRVFFIEPLVLSYRTHWQSRHEPPHNVGIEHSYCLDSVNIIKESGVTW